MGLYFNDENEMHIYKNDEDIAEPQQKMMMSDWLSEWMEEQRKMTQSLSRNHFLLKNQVHGQGQVQTFILERIEQFDTLQKKQADVQNDLAERIILINKRYNDLENELKNNEISKEYVLNELRNIAEATDLLIQSMKDQEAVNKKLFDQFNDLLTVQHDVKEMVDAQDKGQKEMIEKIDEQVATTEKIKQQIGNFRSVIYERSHHLSEKIEEQYEFTSQYIHHLLTGGKDSMTMYVNHSKKN